MFVAKGKGSIYYTFETAKEYKKKYLIVFIGR